MVEVNKDIIFTDTSTNNPTAFDWNFGDGTPPISRTTTNPVVHKYTTAGTYTVTHVPYNACGAGVAVSQVIVVTPPVIVTATVTVTSGAGGYTRVTNNTSGVITDVINTTRAITFNIGDSFKIEAIPLAGYNFSQICTPGCSTTNPTTGTISSSGSAVITFIAQCIPTWVCEIPKNGYESDGCGNRRLNSACNPCTPIWACELPKNGYESDGCGNRRLNSACNPCTPVWTCELPKNGYESDGCGNRRLNSACNPIPVPTTATITVTSGIGGYTRVTNISTGAVYDIVNSTRDIQFSVGDTFSINAVPDTGTGYIFNTICTPACSSINPTFGIISQSGTAVISFIIPCVPAWTCELPLNGYESDGCGNRRLNANCGTPTLIVCPKDPIADILCRIFHLPPPPGYPDDLPALPPPPGFTLPPPI